MRSAIAGAMVLVLGVVQTGLAGLCLCGPADAAAEPEAHECCASAAAAADDEAPRAAFEARCQRGCCERPELVDVRERVSPSDPLEPPQERLVADPTNQTHLHDATPLARAEVALLRGPPPDATARRLARLQMWRC